jgi:hypothetical protein
MCITHEACNMRVAGSAVYLGPAGACLKFKVSASGPIDGGKHVARQMRQSLSKHCQS